MVMIAKQTIIDFIFTSYEFTIKGRFEKDCVPLTETN